MLFWKSSFPSRLQRNLNRRRIGHQKLCLCGFQRTRHLLDIVRGRGPADDAAKADRAEHGDGIPYRVSAEERDGVIGLKVESSDEGGRDVRRRFLDLGPVQAVFGLGINVAGEFVVRVAFERGRRGVEEPIPDRDVCWHWGMC